MAAAPKAFAEAAVENVAFDFRLLMIPLWLCAAYAFWNSISAADPLPAFFLVGAIGGLLWVAEAGILAWLMARQWPGARRCLFHLIAGLLVVASIFLFQWPLRLAFCVAKPELDSIVAKVSQGKRIHFPTRAGPYLIHSIEGGDAWMLSLYGAVGDRTGFVWTPTHTDYPGFNPWSYERLDENWWRVTED